MSGSIESGSVMPGENLIAQDTAGRSKPAAKGMPKFEADKTDGVFALLLFVLGYLFSRWVLVSWQGWGVAAFTALFGVSSLLYFRKKQVAIRKEAWFWFAITSLTGLSYAIWTGSEMGPWRSLLLFAAAVYWIMSATGTQLYGATTNWLPADALNAVFVIPFRNFTCQYSGLAVLRGKRKTKGKTVASVALGVVLALALIFIILPMLLAADSGGFYRIIRSGYDSFVDEFRDVAEIIPYLILTVPVSAYIYGLIAGCVQKRGCDAFKTEAAEKLGGKARILPAATVYTLMGLVSCLYAVFIGSQLPYLFSAFTGKLPEGWRVYSEYARSGFFELCRIAMINLAVLAASNLLIDAKGAKSAAIKLLNTILAVLTLLLIAAAFSKMALYIQEYGLSMKRLLPCVLMAFLAVMCLAFLLLQKRSFSILKTAAVLGTAILCLLCLIDPDGLTVRYNADRYLAGTLADFDTGILYRADAAGVAPALDVLERTKDPDTKRKIEEYLGYQTADLKSDKYTNLDNVQKIIARRKLAQKDISVITQ